VMKSSTRFTNSGRKWVLKMSSKTGRLKVVTMHSSNALFPMADQVLW
jgi:hypothetical protein